MGFGSSFGSLLCRPTSPRAENCSSLGDAPDKMQVGSCKFEKITGSRLARLIIGTLKNYCGVEQSGSSLGS